MSSQKGRRYENELVSDIYRTSGESVIPIQAGYSGNHVAPSPDFIINDGLNVHAVELKRTKKDRYAFELDEIKQLIRFCRQYPPPTYPYLGVRFNRRQLVLVKLWMGSSTDWVEIVESGETLAPVEASATRANNLMVYRPESGEWPSAGDGDDAEYVLETIGFNDTTRVRPDADR